MITNFYIVYVSWHWSMLGTVISYCFSKIILSQQLIQLQESWIQQVALLAMLFSEGLCQLQMNSTVTSMPSDWKWLVPSVLLSDLPGARLWPFRSLTGWPLRGWPPQILPNASLRRWSLSVRKSLRWSSEGSTPIPSQKTSLKRTSGRWLIKVLFQGKISGWVLGTPNYK